MTEPTDPYDDVPRDGELPAPELRERPGGRRLIDGELRGTFLPLREHFREQQQAVKAECHCCTLTSPVIDYRLRYPDERSWALDHYISIEQAREMGREAEIKYSLSVENFRSSHLVCNRRRGSWAAPSPGGLAEGRAIAIIDGEPYEYNIDVGITSERW
jgi:hypothetical protein